MENHRDLFVEKEKRRRLEGKLLSFSAREIVRAFSQDGVINPSSLARRSITTYANCVKVIAFLDQMGIVSIGEKKHRVRLITLTDKGREYYELACRIHNFINDFIPKGVKNGKAV